MCIRDRDHQCRRTRGLLFVVPQLSYVSALSTSVHSFAPCAAHKQFTAAKIHVCSHCQLRLAQERSQVAQLSLCTSLHQPQATAQNVSIQKKTKPHRKEDVASDELHEDGPEAPHVDPAIVPSLEDDLWRAVAAALHVGGEAVVLEAGATEVDELDAGQLKVGDHDVLGLEVAVDEV